MKYFLTCFVLFLCYGCHSQQTFGSDRIRLIKEIPLPGVKGRIDHMDINVQQQLLYVAALGNNSVEVVDLKNGVVAHSIKGISEPQGICYLKAENEMAVASGGTGDCHFFNATNYAKLATVHLGSDADNVRAFANRLFIGYGEGGIAVIDIKSHQQIADIKLPAHPESFQVNENTGKMYVNLPGNKSIAVIDLNSLKVIAGWELNGLRSNFPMSLDNANNLLIAGFRHPAKVVCFNGSSGKEISRADLMEDVDDLFYYPEKKQVFASGGQGYINIYQKDAANKLSLMANIATSAGARTSLLIPKFNQFIVASRAEGNKAAEIRIYAIQ